MSTTGEPRDDGARHDSPAIGRRAFVKKLAGGAALAAAPAAGFFASSCDSSAQPRAVPPVTQRRTKPASSEIVDAATDPAALPRSVGGAALRPPAIPLAVRTPYLSAWLNGTDLAGRWATNWYGRTSPVCGLARVDGETYVFCGDPDTGGGHLRHMTQRSVAVTPTRSVFTFEDGGIRLVAEWLSPVEPGDLRRQCIPLALLTVAVSSIDGRRHSVELYCDVSSEWATGDVPGPVRWTGSATSNHHLAISLGEPRPFSESEEMAGWGELVFSSGPRGVRLSYTVGTPASTRASFAADGGLSDVTPGPLLYDTPVFAFSHRLGDLGATPAEAHFSFGHFASPALVYLGTPLEPLWKRYWSRWQHVVDEFLATAKGTRARAARLDTRVTDESEARGGSEYAALCALALRQAYGACELVTGPAGQPWAFLKEVSSDGDISTTDIIFDSCPVWLHLDPNFLAALLEPILDYAGSRHWNKDYAPHSLGFWPVGDGNPKGAASEPMPVWASAAMCVMAAAYASRVRSSVATTFLSRHKALFSRWASLLERELPDPPRQLTTIDYLGPKKGNVNLAVLGLVGLAAAAEIAGRLGDDRVRAARAAAARRLTAKWAELSADSSGHHLDTAIGARGTWSDLYNAYWDTALGTGLLDESVRKLQASWYLTSTSQYGIAIDSSNPTLGRLDQQVLTAAWLYDHEIGPELIHRVFKYLGHTSYLAPMPDTYDPRTGDPGKQFNWRARPVVGGVFALLLLQQ